MSSAAVFAPLFAPGARVERFGDFANAPTIVVAVPVKDEEDRIGLCLEALACQSGVEFSNLCVLLLLNNTTDGTAAQVRTLAPLAPYRIEMIDATLPLEKANAGWARRYAMDAAAAMLADGGVILTTDADTMPHEDWIEANLREIARGNDGVAGYVMADPMELMQLPPAILERGSLEWEYQQLAAELDARADPELHDPWPRHNQNCGASAAVTLDAYRRIGGLPPLPVGEDRALFEMIRRIDGRIRHSLEAQVVTSARTDGRASGGLADEIRLRTNPDHPCDDALEVAVQTLRRAHWRGLLRAAWGAGRIGAEAQVWARKLKVPVATVMDATRATTFGAAWAGLEAQSATLDRRLVTAAGLKRELRRIRRLVDTARTRAKSAAAQPTPVKKVRVA